MKPLAERAEPFTIKMLPCAMPAVLLAASWTAVMPGVSKSPAPSPVVIVPAPEKVRVRVVPRQRSVPVPGMLGKDPVAPA